MAASSTGIPGISLIPGSGLTTQTFDGVPGGMNLALPPQEIDDTEARYLQDILVDQPGITRRRGPVVGVSGIAALPRKGSGLVAALNPTGASRFGVLTGDVASGFLTVYDSALATVTDLAWPHPLPTSPGTGASYRAVDVKPAMRGGAWIGISSAYDAAAPNQALGLWFGGTKANATITVTAARGSATVTGTGFTAGVDPGMFLFADTDDPYTQAYIGVVKSVDSNTSLTLVVVSGYAITARTGTFQSLRGFAPKVAKGHLTTDGGRRDRYRGLDEVPLAEARRGDGYHWRSAHEHDGRRPQFNHRPHEGDARHRYDHPRQYADRLCGLRHADHADHRGDRRRCPVPHLQGAMGSLPR